MCLQILDGFLSGVGHLGWFPFPPEQQASRSLKCIDVTLHSLGRRWQWRWPGAWPWARENGTPHLFFFFLCSMNPGHSLLLLLSRLNDSTEQQQLRQLLLLGLLESLCRVLSTHKARTVLSRGPCLPAQNTSAGQRAAIATCECLVDL